MTKISLDIQKKDLWLLSSVMIFLIGVGYVIAYNPGASPSVMGYSIDELEGAQKRVTGTCAEGTVTCEPDIETNTVSGWVVGGGDRCNSCSSWGTASCSGGFVTCAAGSTLRMTESKQEDRCLRDSYICIRD